MQKIKLPSDNMADVKLRVQGFRGANADSTSYKAKPARYQTVEELTPEELTELTSTADLTGVIYNYQAPGENGKESIRMTPEEEQKINTGFADADPYSML